MLVRTARPPVRRTRKNRIQLNVKSIAGRSLTPSSKSHGTESTADSGGCTENRLAKSAQKQRKTKINSFFITFKIEF